MLQIGILVAAKFEVVVNAKMRKKTRVLDSAYTYKVRVNGYRASQTSFCDKRAKARKYSIRSPLEDVGT